MRVLICGGRDFTDWTMFNRAMREFYARAFVGLIEVVIHGDARGADTLAKRWAQELGIPDIACPADWDTFGRAAGMIRNQTMLKVHKPGAVIAFPGGRGTAMMVDIAQKALVPVYFGKRLANGD